MEIKKITLPLESIELNSGQIDGLPANPRQWTLTDVEKLAASLKETPELLEMRCPIVVPHEGKYVTLGGNLRIAAASLNKEAQVPCFVLEDATTDKMKEIVIKDNGSFGKWDFDSLANEWTDEPLNDWGLDVWQPKEEARDEGYDTDFSLPDGEKTGLRQVSFSFTDKQAEIVNFGLSVAQYDEGYQSFDKDGNDNESGSAMYYIVSCWLGDKMEEYGDIQAALEEFKPVYLELRTYLRNALKVSGKTASYVDEVLGTAGMSGHYFGDSQWMFPTREAYEKMQMFMPLDRKWEDCTLIVHKYKLLDKLKKYGES